MRRLPLTALLKDATQELHRDAERAGGMGALLRGQVERRDYCIMLRNLHALYAALEAALDRNALSPMVAPVRMPALYRSTALADDLRYLHGDAWQRLPVMAAMRAYVAHIDDVAREHPALLAAHAYVRYMGDLSGGQILRDVVWRALSLDDAEGTAFYMFAGGDIEKTKSTFRAALDSLPVDDDLARRIVAEARAAFVLHIRLFEELAAAPN